MLSDLNTWFGKWEPTWLFALIGTEMFVGIATFVILVIEYHYDKEFNEQLKAAKRESRRKKLEFENLTDGEAK